MPSDRYIPKGAASLQITADGPAREFYFLLLPKLTMLAFSSAIEPCVSQINWRKNSFILGTRLPLTGRAQHVQTGSRSNVMVRWDRFPKSLRLCLFGDRPYSRCIKRGAGWIRQQDRQGAQLGGICTGAFALAQAGVIRDRRFTLHWENQPAFVETFPIWFQLKIFMKMMVN